MQSSRRPESFAAIRFFGRRPGSLPAMIFAGLAALLIPNASQAQAAPAQVRPGPAPQQTVEPGPILLPGLNPDEDDDGLISVNALPSTQTTSTVDGLETTQSFLAEPAGTASSPSPDPEGDSDGAELTGGVGAGLGRGRHAGAPYSFSQAALREIRSTSQNFSARQAHLGVAEDKLTLGGTERYHGSLFVTLHRSAWDAANPLAIATSYLNGAVTTGPVKPRDSREIFGGRVGGPVPRLANVMFFYTFDAQRRDFPVISSPLNPAFYQLTTLQQSVLGNRGVTPAERNAALNYVSSLTGLTPRSADQTIDFGRVDWEARKSLRIVAEYNRVRWDSPAGLSDAPVVARGRDSLGSAGGNLDQALGRVTLTRGRLVSATVFRFSHDLQFEKPQASLPQEPATGPGGAAPGVVIGPNGIVLGTPATLVKTAYPDESRYQLAEDASLHAGRHRLELGGTVAFVSDTTASRGNEAGTFHYDSGRAGANAGGLVDFLSDYTFNKFTNPNGACPAITAAVHLFCFASFTQSFGQETVSFRTQEWAAYADETWSARPGLTLHAGVRYEYTLLPLPQNPNATLDAIFGTRGATGIFPEDRNNFGPRASLAWEPLGAGRGSIKAGYGLFYGRLPGATIAAALTDTEQNGTQIGGQTSGQTTSSTRIRLVPATAGVCSQVSGKSFGYPCSYTSTPTDASLGTGSVLVFDRHFRLPAIQQGSLRVERELGRETLLSVGYVVSLARQLAGSTDLNILPATRTAVYQLQGGTGAAGVRDGETFALPVYTARVTPSFGPVTEVASHVNASYHALEVTAASRPARSVRVRGAYTWSKAIDGNPSLSATPRSDAQLDPFQNGYDKGLSSLNYPWSARVSLAWTPRLEVRREWMARVLSGWQVQPFVSTRAGRPYSLDLFGGTRLAGGHQSLNGSGGALYLPTVGRNTLRLPAQSRVNLSLGRSMDLNRKLRLHVQAEAFNLFNHRQVSAVEQRAYLVGTATGGVTPLVFQSAAAIAAEGLNTQAFGTPTTAGSDVSRERQVQLGARLEF